MDQETTIHELKEKVKHFCEERDWDQFHYPKDLAIAIITEASELLEHFRFKSKKETEEYFTNKTKKEHISDELADIIFFTLIFAQKFNIDISKSVESKLNKNAIKYPVEKAKGSNKKYTEL